MKSQKKRKKNTYYYFMNLSTSWWLVPKSLLRPTCLCWSALPWQWLYPYQHFISFIDSFICENQYGRSNAAGCQLPISQSFWSPTRTQVLGVTSVLPYRLSIPSTSFNSTDYGNYSGIRQSPSSSIGQIRSIFLY